MTTLGEEIVRTVGARPGLTDREITDVTRGQGKPQQAVNQECRALERSGTLVRRKRPDGLIGNYLAKVPSSESSAPSPPPSVERPTIPSPPPSVSGEDPLSEDALKRVLTAWLVGQGWQCQVAWGKTPGIDIVATQGSARWVFEVKGRGSLPAMRVNYFISILGETLQRMEDPNARYSIALPDLPQFRKLWEKLPRLAKTRTGISALFVSLDGHVSESE